METKPRWMNWRMVLSILLVSLPFAARQRILYLTAPAPQGKFPPPWTETIHVSIEELSVSDHRYWKKGQKEFKAALKGHLRHDTFQVEVLCLAKGEKKIAVFRQPLKIQASTKNVKLDQLKFVEELNL